MPISNRCGVKFGRCGFLFKTILARRKCPRKDKKAHKKAHKESGLRSKRERPTPEQNRNGGSRQRALLKENSQTTPKLASANAQQIAALQDENLLLTAELEDYNDLYAATLIRCDEHEARVRALGEKNTHLANQISSKDQIISALTKNLHNSDTLLKISNDELKGMQEKFTPSSWEHLNLEGLYKLFKELEQLTLSLELETRRKVAEHHFTRFNQDCACPISMHLAKDPVLPPCDCLCVFEREMLKQVHKCPTCRADFSPEQVRPINILRNLIERHLQWLMDMDRHKNLHHLVSKVIGAEAVEEGSYIPGTLDTPQTPPAAQSRCDADEHSQEGL